jgi:hypothetical protein
MCFNWMTKVIAGGGIEVLLFTATFITTSYQVGTLECEAESPLLHSIRLMQISCELLSKHRNLFELSV